MMLVFSCEHAVNTIPKDYAPLFLDAQSALDSHAGIDFGAAELAQYLSQFFQAKLFLATVSRLLIDCNRSLKHRNCFSEYTKNLAVDEKKRIIEAYYQSYRQPIEAFIAEKIQAQIPIMHLSIHSFTPQYCGVQRKADLGLLYDPGRKKERYVAASWQKIFKGNNHALKMRLNYPYQGKSDGFTTALRKQYPEEWYLGIEVEVNQAIVQDAPLFALLKTELASNINKLPSAI